MTKIARLPDGQMLEFPDDMPDDQMHREVKKKLGIEVPPTADEMMRAEDVAAAGARNQALSALAQQLGTLTQVVSQLSSDQRATQALLGRVAGAVDQLSSVVNEAAQRVENAVLAPAVQTVTRDDEGRIVKTTLTKGTAR